MTDPSAAWTLVRSLVRQQQPPGDLPVLEVHSVHGEETAMAGLVAWFDRHNEDTAVLLRVDDKDLGIVDQDAVLDAVDPTYYRGGLDAGDGLTLPGLPTDFRLFEYVCPIDGHRRKGVVGFDAGPTPTCPVHGVAMVPDAAR
jgi:hypothetical protein